MNNAARACWMVAALAAVAPAFATDTICTPKHSGHPKALPLVDPYEKLSVRKLEKLAAKHDAGALGQLGILYGTGHGVKLDAARAFEYYRRASDLGNANAQANLAFMYLNGEGVAKDPAKALEWARRSADVGNFRGQQFTGFLLGTGAGVEKDEMQAAFCYLLAAKQGSVDAQFTLSRLFSEGVGVPVDREQAALWRERGRAARATQKLWIDATPIESMPAEWESPYTFIASFEGPVTVDTPNYSFNVAADDATKWDRFTGKQDARKVVLRSGLAGYDTYAISVMPKGTVAAGENAAAAARREFPKFEFAAAPGAAGCVRTSAKVPVPINDGLLGMFAYCIRPADRELYEISVTWKSLQLRVPDPEGATAAGAKKMSALLDSALSTLKFK